MYQPGGILLLPGGRSVHGRPGPVGPAGGLGGRAMGAMQGIPWRGMSATARAAGPPGGPPRRGTDEAVGGSPREPVTALPTGPAERLRRGDLIRYAPRRRRPRRTLALRCW